MIQLWGHHIPRSPTTSDDGTVSGMVQHQVGVTQTWRQVQMAQAALTTEALHSMKRLPWFRELSAAHRADVGLVVQAGICTLVAWLRDREQQPCPAPDVFGAAPVELTRAVSLQQTVQLIRVVVGVLDAHVPTLASPGEEQELREAVLIYSREVAFAAAEVYAGSAEARGAWDARLEASVVEALVHGAMNDSTLSRAVSLGWGRPSWTTALAASSPTGPVEPFLSLVRHHARRSDLQVLAGESNGRLLVVLGGHGSVEMALDRIAAIMSAGPIVVGDVVDDLASVGPSAHDALAGLAAVAAWPGAPRPVLSSALLAERAIIGDQRARLALREQVYDRLAASSGDLLLTCATFLDAGGNLEATARDLYVHANTVRYRLRKVTERVGLDLTRPRDAMTTQVALVLGRAHS